MFQRKKKNLGILQAKIQIHPTIAVALKERHIEKRDNMFCNLKTVL